MPIVKVLRYLRFFKKEIVLNVLFNLLAVLFNLGTFVMIVPFVELLFGISTPPDHAPQLAFNQEALSQWMVYELHARKATLGIWPCLLAVSGGYLALNLLSNLFRYLALFFLSPIRNGIIERIRGDLFHRITILPVSYFNSQRRGDIVSRLSNDLADVEWSVVSTLQSLVKDPVNIVVFCFVLIFISARLFFLFLLVLPLSVYLIARIGRSLKRNSTAGQTQLGQLFARLDEALSSMRVVRAFGQEGRTRRQFREVNDSYARSMVRVARRRELSSPLSEVLGTVGLVAILILGGSQVLQGRLLSSVFILFVILFARLIPPVQALVKTYNSLQKGSASAARIFEVMEADEKITEAPDALRIDTFTHSIEYRNVSFAYNSEAVIGEQQPASPNRASHLALKTNNSKLNYILRDISFTLPRGTTVALVGPSGAGKTTLADLLPRFYDVTSGEILIDGHPIKQLNIDSLRALIGIVSQDCILFNDTVAANIAFGQPGATMADIQAAARAAFADEFIERLPQGYDTVIGNRGTLLSGGQRQRICIARALLKDPPILVLDEATSALDAQSEHAVQQALERLMKDRTVLVIAHRLATIQNADRILVLDHGRIVQRGTHATLQQEEGLYKTLTALQHLDQ
ncbi:MAG: ABC transporter ATP-binding protein [Bacteroidales bacterium]|nr:ABC transporter ATP-binding protein [Bacteroidales bacterium]